LASFQARVAVERPSSFPLASLTTTVMVTGTARSAGASENVQYTFPPLVVIFDPTMLAVSCGGFQVTKYPWLADHAYFAVEVSRPVMTLMSRPGLEVFSGL